MRNNVKTYQRVNRESGLMASDPHIIISMLFDGIFESISVAKGAIKRNDLFVKSQQLTKAMSIIRSLQDSLDTDSEPAISASFYDLYAYCIVQITEASVSLDCTVLDEVTDLLKPLSDAWKNISEEDKQKGFALLKSKEESQQKLKG